MVATAPRRRVADDGAELGRGDRRDARVDEPVAAAGEPGAQEGDAVIGFGGMQDDRDRAAGVDADARKGDRAREAWSAAASCLVPLNPRPKTGYANGALVTNRVEIGSC